MVMAGCVALVVYIYVGIQKNRAQTEEATVMVVNAAPFSVEPPTETLMTAYRYDLDQLQKALQMIVGGCCLAGGMNYYNGLIIPFVVQSLLFPYNLTQNPLYKIYINGEAARGELARPFAFNTNPLMQAMEQQQKMMNNKAKMDLKKEQKKMRKRLNK